MAVPGAEHPPMPWTKLHLTFGPGGLAALLADRLLQQVHAVHAGVRVAEAAAVGVQRQLAAGRRVALGDEGAGLAALTKPVSSRA